MSGEDHLNPSQFKSEKDEAKKRHPSAQDELATHKRKKFDALLDGVDTFQEQLDREQPPVLNTRRPHLRIVP